MKKMKEDLAVALNYLESANDLLRDINADNEDDQEECDGVDEFIKETREEYGIKTRE